jgi:ABC-type ATPase with predicted acetyltransferase domain
MNYSITKKFSSSVKRTPRVMEVAEAFGLGLSAKEFTLYENLEIEINTGDICYITGQSGSGKSVLMRDLAKKMNDEGLRVTDIDQIKFDEVSLIDQIGTDMTSALRLLSLAGLNDAYLFIRKPSELSDGQKYRFRLAKLIESNAQVWVADEFTASLDRVTAKVVAFNLQKVARSLGATVLLATTHMDLNEELAPNLYVEKYFRDRVKVTQLESK